MVDFFNFREQLIEKKNSDEEYDNKKKKKQQLDELEKDADDPCWDGYVQLGTKKKNGKEVPNCVPMEEARRQVKEATQIDEMYYDTPDYGPIGASEMKMTQLHFIKYAADEIIGCLESGCIMPEWYQNKVAKVEGEVEGLLSYMKGKKRKAMSRRYSGGMGMYEQTETLTESKTVEVSVRDARKANDIASDVFRGEYKNDGSTIFVFKKSSAADDFRAELENQDIELMEAKSGDKKAYRKFFNKALKKFGVDSPAKLKGEKEKEFYDYVDKNWKSDKEQKNESVRIDEKNVPLDKLKRGNTYTVKMDGKKGKVKVDSIRMDGGEVIVKMTYMDNSIGKKGETVTQGLDQGGDDDVFMESYITEKLKPSDDVSKWIEDFYQSDAPQFEGKSKEERREMAVAAWLEARREAGYDVGPNPNEETVSEARRRRSGGSSFRGGSAFPSPRRGSSSKDAFKRREMEKELGDEPNQYTVVIDGKAWKSFSSKRAAEKAANTIKTKYGKNVKIRY